MAFTNRNLEVERTNRVLEIFRSLGERPPLEKFVLLFEQLDSTHIRHVIWSLCHNQTWTNVLYEIAPNDEDWHPFLSDAMESMKVVFTAAINKGIVKLIEMLAGDADFDEADTPAAINLMRIVAYSDSDFIDSGLDEPLEELINKDQLDENLRRQGALTLAGLKMTDSRLKIIKSIPVKHLEFFLDPVLLGLRDANATTILSVLEGLIYEPIITNSIRYRLGRLCIRLNEEYADHRISTDEMLFQYGEIGEWWRNKIREAAIFYDLELPLVDTFHQIDRMLDRFKYASSGLHEEFFYLISPIYDLAILQFMDETGIASEFGLKLTGLKFNMEQYREVVTNRTSESLDSTYPLENEDDLIVLLEPEKLEIYHRFLTYPNGEVVNDYDKLHNRLLIALPSKLLNEDTWENSTDIAIANGFQYGFIVNRPLVEFTKDINSDSKNSADTSPTQFSADILSAQLRGLFNGGYVVDTFEDRAPDIVKLLFKELNPKLPDKNFLPMREGRTKGYPQNALIEILSDNSPDALKSLVVTTGPVLAFAYSLLDRNDRPPRIYKLFNLEDLRNVIRSKKMHQRRELLRRLQEAYSHTAIHLNIPREQALRSNDRNAIMKLLSMTLYTVDLIRRDSGQRYSKFVVNSVSRFDDLTHSAIFDAIRDSYIYFDPTSYDESIYGMNVGYPEMLPYRESASKVLYLDLMKRFAELISAIDELLGPLTASEPEKVKEALKPYVKYIASRIEKRRFELNIWEMQKEIVRHVRDYLEGVIIPNLAVSEHSYSKESAFANDGLLH